MKNQLLFIKKIQTTKWKKIVNTLIFNITIFAFLLIFWCSVYSQAPTVESQSKKNTRTFTLVISPLSKPIIITKVGVKISNVKASRGACHGALPYETKDSRPIQPDATYSIQINVIRKEQVIEEAAEPILITEPGKPTVVSISVLPNLEYFDTCFYYWQFDISTFLKYRNIDKTEGTIFSEMPITYTEKDYVSYDGITSPLPIDELKAALKHISPTIRLYAIRQLAASNININLAEGILSDKLENDPSEEVKIAAAYAAGRLHIKSLGKLILSQLKITQNADAVEIYCWALAELRHTDAIDWLFRILFNLNFTTSKFENYEREYKISSEEALVRLKSPDEISLKAEEYFIKYQAWAGKNVANRQAERFSKLVWILLEYRDIKSLPLLLKILNQSRFESLNNRVLEKWGDFLYGENSENSNKLITDEFLLGLKLAIKATFDSKYIVAPETNFNPIYKFIRFRSSAFGILCRMPLKAQELETLLLQGFQDKDVYVKEETVEIICILELKKFIPNMTSLLKNSSSLSDFFRERLCKCLKRLGASCKN